MTEEQTWAEMATEMSDTYKLLSEAGDNRQYREVTKRCFGVLISLARLTYDPEIHRNEDEENDADEDQSTRGEVHRNLKSVIRYLFQTSKKKNPRMYVLKALKHALKLHQKGANTYEEAAQCLVSTTSVVNMVTLTMGRRLC